MFGTSLVWKRGLETWRQLSGIPVSPTRYEGRLMMVSLCAVRIAMMQSLRSVTNAE